MYNLLDLAVWGHKSKTYRRLTTKRRKPIQKHIVLNDRAMLRLSGRLFNNLPRDVAISVLNDIKQYAK